MYLLFFFTQLSFSLKLESSQPTLARKGEGTALQAKSGQMSAVSQSIRAHRIGGHGFFPASKLTDLYRGTRTST